MGECPLLNMEDCLRLNTAAFQVLSMVACRPHNMEDYQLLSMVACRRPRAGGCPRPLATSIEATFRRGPILLENWKREDMSGHPY